MVDALVPPAQQAEAVGRRQFGRQRLVEASPARAEQEQRSRRIDRLDGLEDRLGPHHHAGAAAERRIVDRSMDIGRLLADVVASQIEQARTAGLAQQALGAEVVDERGEQREDVDAQRAHGESRSNSPSGVSTTITPSAFDTTKFDGTSAPESSSSRSAAGFAMTDTHTP